MRHRNLAHAHSRRHHTETLLLGVILVCSLLTPTLARTRVRRGQTSGYGGGGGGGSSGGGGYGGGAGGGGGYQNDGGNYNNSPQTYKYEYGVYDDQYGTDFGQSEERDGQGTVRGQYKVRLPDGRLQIVTYVADSGGYRATVEYQDGGGGGGGSGSGGYGAPTGGGGGGGQYASGRGRNFVNIMRQINGRTFNQSY